MWLKKCTCFLLACVAVFGCLFTPVAAAELGEQKVEIEERRASGKFDFDIPAKTLMKASSSFPMEYGETVNVMLERRLKANYRTGFWEMIFLHTKPLAAVPSDMRAGRN